MLLSMVVILLPSQNTEFFLENDSNYAIAVINTHLPHSSG